MAPTMGGALMNDRGRTGRRNADEARRWTDAIDQSRDLIALTDVSGRFLQVNRSFVASLGRTPEETIGQHFSVAFAPETPPSLIEEVGQKAYRADGWQGECLFARADGTSLPILLWVGPFRDSAGQVVGALGIGRDIAERKQIEASLRASEERFRHLAESIREVFFTVELDPIRMSYISPAYEDIWGRRCEDLYRNPLAWLDAIHQDDRVSVQRDFERSLQGLPTDSEYRIVRPDGGTRWIHARAFPARDSGGNLVRMVGVAEDITRRWEEAHALRQTHRKLDQALLEAARQTQISDKLTELVDIIQSSQTADEAYRVIGEILPAVLGAPSGTLSITSASRNVVESVASWGASISPESSFPPDQCWALRRGKVHVVEDATSPLRCGHVAQVGVVSHICVPLAAQGETLGVLCLAGAGAGREAPTGEALGRQAMVVGERLSLALGNLKLREILRWQSIRDPLTGLFNRRYMEESLERDLRRAARSGERVSFLMIDIDHFKRFNDTFGHQAGDTLLRSLGDLLQAQTRHEDVACRYGGEEFALILVGADAVSAAHRAEHLRERAAQLVVPYGDRILGRITLSVGLAEFPEHGSTAHDLVRAADRALYEAKAQGRDRLVTAEGQPAGVEQPGKDSSCLQEQVITHHP
jgi:diguanylate cyclase (GGDEF)-like protein/PAS domain S-box-containing protein